MSPATTATVGPHVIPSRCRSPMAASFGGFTEILSSVNKFLPAELNRLNCWFHRTYRSVAKRGKKVGEVQKAAKQFGIAAVIANGLSAAVIGFAAPSQAAPSGPSNAEQTISQLQAQGYKVIVNRLGSAPLDQSTVVAVRHGQNFSRVDTLNDTVTQRTVYVDVK
jgi:hypothetical protein